VNRGSTPFQLSSRHGFYSLYAAHICRTEACPAVARLKLRTSAVLKHPSITIAVATADWREFRPVPSKATLKCQSPYLSIELPSPLG